MRSVVALLAIIGLGALFLFVSGAVVSYLIGPVACVVLAVALAVWVGWVLFDCWFLSDLDDAALALVVISLCGFVTKRTIHSFLPSGPTPPPAHARRRRGAGLTGRPHLGRRRRLLRADHGRGLPCAGAVRGARDAHRAVRALSHPALRGPHAPGGARARGGGGRDGADRPAVGGAQRPDGRRARERVGGRLRPRVLSDVPRRPDAARSLPRRRPRAAAPAAGRERVS